MTPFRSALFAGTAFLAACGASSPADAGAASATAQKMSDEEFDRRLREALVRNPQMIIEALEVYREELEAQAAAATEDAVRAALPDLVKASSGVGFGADAENAELVIIEFFDYHCGFCRRALDEVLGILEDKASVRVVFQELPVLREESRTAALTALAAAQLGDDAYRKAHLAMMRHGGLLSGEAIDRVLKEAGLNVMKLDRIMETDRAIINDRLEDSIDHGRRLGVNGTPFFIIYNVKTQDLRLLEGYQPGYVDEAVADVLG